MSRFFPLLLLATLLPLTHARAAEVPACPPSAVDPIPLPNLAAVLARHEPAVIVAIGSSTTRSWLASDPAHSYPAILQAALGRALPHAHVAVLNRGINGQDVTEELARLDSDVLAVRPAAVIWQVGANGALHSANPVGFRKLVTAGVARLHASGADVILMDNQRAPRLLAVPDNVPIGRALADVARDTEAELFSRSALMDAWAAAGVPYERFLSSDNLHHNDYGYRCLAEALAAAMVAGLGSREPGASGPGSDGGTVPVHPPATPPATQLASPAIGPSVRAAGAAYLQQPASAPIRAPILAPAQSPTPTQSPAQSPAAAAPARPVDPTPDD